MDRNAPDVGQMALFVNPHTASLDPNRRHDSGIRKRMLGKNRSGTHKTGKRHMKAPLTFHRRWKEREHKNPTRFPVFTNLSTVNSVVHQHAPSAPSEYEHLFSTRAQTCSRPVQPREQLDDSRGRGVKLQFSGTANTSSTIVAGSKTPQAGVLRLLTHARGQGGPVQISVHNTVASGEFAESVDLDKLATSHRATQTTTFPGLSLMIENGDDSEGKGRTTVGIPMQLLIRARLTSDIGYSLYKQNKRSLDTYYSRSFGDRRRRAGS